MSETTSTDIRRGAKAVYLATSESVAQEIEQQLLAGADAMDRLAEAEALLEKAADALRDHERDALADKIDEFLSGGSNP